MKVPRLVPKKEKTKEAVMIFGKVQSHAPPEATYPRDEVARMIRDSANHLPHGLSESHSWSMAGEFLRRKRKRRK